MDPGLRRLHNDDRMKQQLLYDREGYVGEGAFGVVLKAVKKQDPAAAAASSSSSSASSTAKHYVAIKQMMNQQREGQGIPQDAYREIKILKELRHENIVHLDRIFTRPDKHEVDLVYEYADHDLAEIIKVNRSKMQTGQLPDPRFVKSVMQQVLTGLAFLHKNWCMHRDMKPANILVSCREENASGSEDGGGKIKIADFGLARIFQSPLRKLADDGEVVTIWYRAPELLLGSRHYTRAIDIFAVGCIFFELMACAPLFPGNEMKGQKVFQENQVKEVFKNMGKPTLEGWKGMQDCPFYVNIKNWPAKDYPSGILDSRLPRGTTDAAKSLLKHMLHYDPGQRYTAEQCLAHAYFKEEPKPDRNVFRDQYGGWLQYNSRPSKPLSDSKRAREGQAAQHQQLQQQQAATAALAASSAAAQYPLPPQHQQARHVQQHHQQQQQQLGQMQFYLQDPNALALNAAAQGQNFPLDADFADPQIPPHKVRRVMNM